MVHEMGLDRITRSPEVMGDKPCLRGMRITIGTVIGLVASGRLTGRLKKANGPPINADERR